MKVLDLFSGIGGFALGMESVGFETTMFCEINEHARSVLKKHWPDVHCHKDILDLHITEGQFDIICGGFPCQDISVYGTGLGLSGERSGLWSEYSRLIKEGKPKYVVIENSSNLRNNGLRRVLTDLWESGYDAEWYCLEAGQFGAPHLRERIIIVAYPNGTREERLVTDESLKELGQRQRCSAKDLQVVYDNPFGRSDSWPKPLLRRGDDGLFRRVDRLTRVGNAIYPELTKFIAKIIYESELSANDQ